MNSSDLQKKPVLPEFQQYLLDKKLVPENRLSFYAHWVSRYLSYANKQMFDASEYNEQLILRFLEDLRLDKRIRDWQPRQAEDALNLYYFHYLGKTCVCARAISPDSGGDLTSETVRIIRLKHYSYSTERAYIQWIERFASYIKLSGKELNNADDSDIKNYLSHLALKHGVSSSTQNQAFYKLSAFSFKPLAMAKTK